MRTLLLVVTLLASTLATVVPARADDPSASPEVRALVREEIKAYLEAEKKKKTEEDRSSGLMKVSWKDGPLFESADKRFKARLIGRVETDYWTFPDADEDLETALGDEFDTGVFFRRARLGIDMTILKNTRVKFEYDFARGGANQNGFADAFVAFQGSKDCACWLPDVTVGHFKEPFGLEEMTSVRATTFIERSLSSLTFNPVRNTGVMLEKGFLPTLPAGEKAEPFDRLFLQLGAFSAFSNNFGDGVFSDADADEFVGDQDGWAITGRASCLPWVDCSCPDCRLIHLGLAGSYRGDLRPDNLRFRTRPEVGIGPRTVDTGPDVVADSVLLIGAEAALVYDRVSLQAEYVVCDVDAPTQDDPLYSGWYAQASYFLTGECRAYERGRGRFGMVKPCRPFFCDACRGMGPGAWEVAARFSTIDLNDGVPDVRGGKEWDLTLGVNWYVNDNFRVMLDYVHVEIDDRPVGAGNTPTDGTVDAVGIRFAVIW